MAVVDEVANIYKNADGLRLRLGNSQSLLARVGAPHQAGSNKVIEVDIVGTELGVFTQNNFVGGIPTVVMPAGHIVKSCILTVIEAFDSAADALTMDIGTANQDGTVVDIDGIDVAIAQGAIDAIGEVVTCDGALIDTLLASDQYVTIRINAATATAGIAKLIITLLPTGDLI